MNNPKTNLFLTSYMTPDELIHYGEQSTDPMVQLLMAAVEQERDSANNLQTELKIVEQEFDIAKDAINEMANTEERFKDALNHIGSLLTEFPYRNNPAFQQAQNFYRIAAQ